MQDFTLIPGTQTLTSSRELLLQNSVVAMTNTGGNSFPTFMTDFGTNSLDTKGMTHYKFGDGLYILDSTWSEWNSSGDKDSLWLPLFFVDGDGRFVANYANTLIDQNTGQPTDSSLFVVRHPTNKNVLLSQAGLLSTNLPPLALELDSPTSPGKFATFAIDGVSYGGIDHSASEVVATGITLNNVPVFNGLSDHARVAYAVHWDHITNKPGSTETKVSKMYRTDGSTVTIDSSLDTTNHKQVSVFEKNVSITGAGTLSVAGNVSLKSKLDVTSHITNSGDVRTKGNVNAEGNITSKATVTAPSIFSVQGVGMSDKRIKDNIRDLTNAEELVSALRPRRYYNKKLKKEMVGFIAQEVEEVLPCAVAEHNDLKYIDIVPIVAALTETVNNLLNQIRQSP